MAARERRHQWVPQPAKRRCRQLGGCVEAAPALGGGDGEAEGCGQARVLSVLFPARRSRCPGAAERLMPARLHLCDGANQGVLSPFW